MSFMPPQDFLNNAEDQIGLADYLRNAGLPLGQIQAPQIPSPDARIGPVRLPGSRLDSASLAILQALQNAPQPRNFGQGLVQGLAGGFAGSRARSAQSRMVANEQAQKSAAEMEQERRKAATEYARGLAAHRWRASEQTAARANRPAGRASQMVTLPDGTQVPMTSAIATGLAKQGGLIPAQTDVGIKPKLDPAAEARIKRIAPKIANGVLSPDLNDYGRDSQVRLALADEVTSMGADLKELSNQYLAEKTFLRSANGSVALRLSRNVVNARESINNTEKLLGQSLEAIPRGSLTLMNKAAMTAAAEGMYGPKAAAMARQLRAQVAAVRFELANIYMGGTAPTDQSVKKAVDMIDSDWSEAGLRGALALARRDLNIRVAAMKEVGPVRLRGGKPEGLPEAGPETPAGAEKDSKKIDDWLRRQ